MRQIISVSILLILFCSSCVSFYVPNPINVPMISEEGEAEVSLTTGLLGTGVQGAYGISEDFSIALNSNFSYQGVKDQGNFRNGFFTELAIGYKFYDISEDSFFDVYGGGGYGAVDASYSVSLYHSGTRQNIRGEYYRFFLQPSFNVKRKRLNFAMSMRGVFFNSTIVKHNTGNDLTSPFFHIEPALTLKAGNRLKFLTQIGASFNPIPTQQIENYRPLLITMGLSYRFKNNNQTK